MLVSEIHSKPYFQPAELDLLWREGWFRSGNLMGRSKVIQLDNSLYTTTPTRLHLEHYHPSKSLRRLLARSKGFRMEVDDLRITSRVESLYRSFAKRFNIPFPSIHWYLNNATGSTPFHSKQVSIYDGDRLVATSVFDCGSDAISSIIGLYQEDYKKYSPGILTMLMEVMWAKENGYSLYYPGYIMMENPKMDYKLRLGPLEFLNDERQWVPDFMVAMRSSVVKEWVSKSNQLVVEMNTYRIPHVVDLANQLPYLGPEATLYTGYPINLIVRDTHYEKSNLALIAAWHPESRTYQLRTSIIYYQYEWFLEYLRRAELHNDHSLEEFNQSLEPRPIQSFEHPKDLCEAILEQVEVCG